MLVLRGNEPSPTFLQVKCCSKSATSPRRPLHGRSQSQNGHYSSVILPYGARRAVNSVRPI